MSLRRRSREISIFSTSALDLFASALAAFIVITMIMMPFFLKYDEILVQQVEQLQARVRESQLELEQTRAELVATQQALEQTQSALEQCQQERDAIGTQLAQCVEDLSSTFLTILIRWDTDSDVDLHVIDPAGNEFFYDVPTFAGVPGELTEDVTDGPGVEVFEEANARIGTFQVSYNLFSLRGEATEVTGAVYSRQGRQELPPVTLQSEGQRESVATLTVDSDGTVRLVSN